MAVRSHFLCRPVDPIVLEGIAGHFLNPLRFAACIVCFKKLSVLFVTLYLWCSEGLTERNNQILLSIHMLKQLLDLPIVCIGDFNMTTQEFLESGWLEKFSASLLAPNTPTMVSTSGSRDIDFGFISNNIKCMHKKTMPVSPSQPLHIVH